MAKLTKARERVLRVLVEKGGKASPFDLGYPRSHMMHQLEMNDLVTVEGRKRPWGGPNYDGFWVITEAGRAALASE